MNPSSQSASPVHFSPPHQFTKLSNYLPKSFSTDHHIATTLPSPTRIKSHPIAPAKAKSLLPHAVRQPPLHAQKNLTSKLGRSPPRSISSGTHSYKSAILSVLTHSPPVYSVASTATLRTLTATARHIKIAQHIYSLSENLRNVRKARPISGRNP